MEAMNWLDEISQELGKPKAFVVEVESTIIRHYPDTEATPVLDDPRVHDGMQLDNVVFLEYLREFSRKQHCVVYADVVIEHFQWLRTRPEPIEIIYYHCPHYDSQHELLEALKSL